MAKLNYNTPEIRTPLGVDQPTLHVLHVGIFGDFPGGMAQVVNRYLSWGFPATELGATLSTRGRHDPLAPWFTFLSVFAILKFRIRRKQGVAVFHLSERGSFIREGLLLLGARAIGLATVAHLHGAQFAQFADSNPRAAKRVLRAADAIGVLSERTERVVHDLLGSTANVWRVPNGVDVPPLPSGAEKKRIIVFGGEVGHRKGADVLVSSWADVSKRHPDWSLVLVGPVTDQLIDLADLERIELVGAVPHSELLAYLDSAAVAILPSRDEALPMFLLEAMAHGCCVIGTDVGQIASIVTTENGFLVQPGDEPELARAIDQCLSKGDAEIRRRGSASHEIVLRHYSPEVTQRALLQLWRSALGPRRNPEARG